MTSCLWPAFLPGLAPHAQDRNRGAVAARGFSRWLPASGHEPYDLPLSHHYLDDPEQMLEASLRTDIHLPLA